MSLVRRPTVKHDSTILYTLPAYLLWYSILCNSTLHAMNLKTLQMHGPWKAIRGLLRLSVQPLLLDAPHLQLPII